MDFSEGLDKNNFLLFASRNYYSPRCIDAEEFFEDLSRFKYIKRLVNRYQRGGDLGERLILNHLTIIMNVFGYDAGLQMLEYKIGMDNWHIMKPFLVLLKAIREDQYTGTHMDQDVVEKLRNI